MQDSAVEEMARPEAGRGDRRSAPSAPQLLLHVGFVKTGSTWLQRHLTNSADRGFVEVADRRATRELLIQPYDLWYDPTPFRRHVGARLDAARRGGLTPVLTHERLSGNPISGGVDAGTLALRLAEQFSEMPNTHCRLDRLIEGTHFPVQIYRLDPPLGSAQ